MRVMNFLLVLCIVAGAPACRCQQPDFPDTHLNLGITLELKGDLDGAIAEYRQALRLKPDFPGAKNNLAIALRLKGGVDGDHH